MRSFGIAKTLLTSDVEPPGLALDAREERLDLRVVGVVDPHRARPRRRAA